MSTAIIVALVSGVLSLAAAAVSFWSAQRVARLNSELEEQPHARSQRGLAAKLRARYRDPLLSAAFDLQSRLHNIVAQSFLVRYYVQGGEGERAYGGSSPWSLPWQRWRSPRSESCWCRHCRRGCARGAPGRRPEGGLRVFAYSLAT